MQKTMSFEGDTYVNMVAFQHPDHISRLILSRFIGTPNPTTKPGLTPMQRKPW
jgi:hypothetical protein